jgi:uncharacterized membrane protein
VFHPRILGLAFLFSICLFFFIGAHEVPDQFANQEEAHSFTYWLAQVGRFHYLMLHFPIALIVMTVAAECLWFWFSNPLFDHAARFMIAAAAIFAVPTALLGFALSYGEQYEGVSLDLFLWHRYFGLLTTGLAIIAAILRERFARQKFSSLMPYYICLFFLFLSVSLTGAFGGSLAFGIGFRT